MLASFLPDAMERKKNVFLLFLCFGTNSAIFLLEEACICSDGLADKPEKHEKEPQKEWQNIGQAGA